MRVSKQVTDQLGRFYLDEAGLLRFEGCLELADDLAGVPNIAKKPFAAQGIAHLVREALGEISKAMPDPLDGKWQTISRSVVDAKTRLDAAAPDQRDDALDQLAEAINELGLFHQGQTHKHERGLTNLVAATTGATVMPDTAKEFGSLVGGLSRAAHNSQPLDQVVLLHDHAVEILELVFGHPEARATRLQGLASLDQPNSEDALEAISLITTDYELRSFLSSVPNSQWLWSIGHVDLLKPSSRGSYWPVILLGERLRSADAASIAGWLKKALAQWGNDLASAEAIASAARSLGEYGQSTLLKSLARHPKSESIKRDVRSAVQQAAPDDEFVERAFIALGRQM